MEQITKGYGRPYVQTSLTVFAEKLDERRFRQLDYVLILFLIVT